MMNDSITAINKLLWNAQSSTNLFPPLHGDKTIQIGCSFTKYGETVPYRNVMLVVGTCEAIEDAEVMCYRSEKRPTQGFSNIGFARGSGHHYRV